jgi:hypothetical protein
MLETDKIVKARITPIPKALLDPMPEVWVTVENGQEEKLFSYYPDEISFVAEEFIGLTVKEARHLKFRKDRDYLRT